MLRLTGVLGIILGVIVGCAEASDPPRGDVTPGRNVDVDAIHSADIDAILQRNLERMQAYADSIEAALRPVPLLTPPRSRPSPAIAMPTNYRRHDGSAWDSR
jgi:hypothetical protein